MADRSRLVKRADTAFSKYVRLRDGKCRKCGLTMYLQCAHLKSRRYHAIRWDERNAIALCRACHVYYTHRPDEWDRWIRRTFGSELIDRLNDLAHEGRTEDGTLSKYIDVAAVAKDYEAKVGRWLIG